MAFLRNVQELAQLQQKEIIPFLFLFAYSLLFGLTVAFFFAPANSIFITHHGVEELPLGYAASGILGICLVLVYSRFQTRVQLRYLYPGALLLLFVLVSGILAFGFFTAPSPATSKLFAAMVFVCATPLITIGAMVFSGLVLHTFDLRQSKRLFALISSGEIVSSVIGYLSIPLLLSFLGNERWLFLFSLATLGASILLLFILLRVLSLGTRRTSKWSDSKPQEPSKSFLKEPYYRAIAVGTLLSVVTIYVVDYGFLNGTKLMVESGVQLSVVEFIALCFAIVKVGELVMSLLSGRLLSQFGLHFGLNLLPTVLFGCFVLLLIVSSISSSVTLFFLFFTIGKLVERVLRRSLNTPATQLLYQPVPRNEKIHLQTIMDGIIPQAATVFAGMLLFVFSWSFSSRTDTFFLISFSLLAALLFACWFVSTLRVYHKYRHALEQMVMAAGHSRYQRMTDVTPAELFSGNILIRHAREKPEGFTRTIVYFLLLVRPKRLRQMLLDISHVPIERLATWVKEQIENTHPEEGKTEAGSSGDEMKNEDLPVRACLVTPLFDGRCLTADVEDIASTNDRTLPLETVTISHPVLVVPTIIDTPVNNFLRVALKNGSAEMYTLNELDDVILTPTITSLDFEFPHQLTANQQGSLSVLFDSLDSFRVRRLILELYSRLPRDVSIRLLLPLLKHADMEIRSDAICMLSAHCFQGEEADFAVLNESIDEHADYLAWLHACIADLDADPDTEEIDILPSTQELIATLESQLLEYRSNLFHLLGFRYQRTTAEIILDQLEKGTIEDRMYALELIDNFLPKDVTSWLIPLFEESSHTQKLRRINNDLPQQRFSFIGRLCDILNKDFSFVDEWVKACALHTLESIATDPLPREVFSLLHHPHMLLHETAARLIRRISPESFHTILSTLPQDIRNHLNGCERNDFRMEDLLFYKIQVFKTLPVFSSLRVRELIRLVKLFRRISIPAGNHIVETKEDSSAEVYIFEKGSFAIPGSGPCLDANSVGQVLCEYFRAGNSMHEITAVSDSTVYVAKTKYFFTTVMDDADATNNFFVALSTSIL